MASNVTAQSMLDKISEGHLKCAICCDRFKEPTLLDCLHSFCLKCLQDLRQGQDPNNKKLPCPLCRRETLLQDKEVADLPTNFTLAALVEEFTVQEQLLEGQQSKIKCQACDEGNQATSRCMDCDHFLCQECQKQHERMAVMKSHKICTLVTLQSGEVAYKSKLREKIPKCRTHQDQNLNIFCGTCDRLVCTTCSLLEHGKHSLIDLSEALAKCKHDIAELAAKADKSKREMVMVMNETVKSCMKLDTAFADVNRKISETADKEVARITEEERRLKQQLEKIFEDRKKKFEIAAQTINQDVTAAERKLHKVNQLMDQASSHEILNLKHKLMHNLTEVTRKQPQGVPDDLSFIDFEKGGKSLGRLVPEGRTNLELRPDIQETTISEPLHLKEKWKLKMQTKTFGLEKTEFGCALDVTAFSNAEIIIADLKHKQLIPISTIPKSPVNSEGAKFRDNLDNSSLQVSVNKDDHLVVLHGPVVKVFNRDFKFLHQFTPCRKSDITPTCLAVDYRNWIAVGYKHTEEVSLHNSDGTLVKTVPAPMIGDHMTTYKGQLIYTNFERKKLLSVDYNGDTIFSVDVPGKMLMGPTGVCCDGDGGIYVAVCRHFLKGGIYQFSPDGKYLRCVIKKCAGSPRGITFTSDGELVLAEEQFVQIYHRA